jgi:hypothetical protein
VRDAQDGTEDGDREAGVVVFGDEVGAARVVDDGEGGAVWPWSLLALGTIAAAFFFAGARRLRTPAEAER